MIELIMHRMQERIDSRRKHILSGAYKDFSAYREAVGELRGLEDALEIIRTTNEQDEFEEE